MIKFLGDRLIFTVSAILSISLLLLPTVAGADQGSLERALSDPDMRDCAVRHLLPIQQHNAPVTVVINGDFVNVPGQAEVKLTYDIFNRLTSSVSEWNGHTVESVREYAYTCPYDFLKSLRRESWELLKNGKVIGVQETVYENGAIVSDMHDGEPVPILNLPSLPEPTRECDKTSLPRQIRDTPRTLTEKDSKLSATITFDVYDRLIFISEQLPLGYVAETSYVYFDSTRLDKEHSVPGHCNYRERKSIESGRLLKDDKVRATYRIVFSEDGSIVEQTSDGGRFVRFVLSILAPILGYDTADPEGEEWIQERFQ